MQAPPELALLDELVLEVLDELALEVLDELALEVLDELALELLASPDELDVLDELVLELLASPDELALEVLELLALPDEPELELLASPVAFGLSNTPVSLMHPAIKPKSMQEQRRRMLPPDLTVYASWAATT